MEGRPRTLPERFASIGNVFFAPDAAGRVIEEAKLEAAEFNKTYEWYPQRMGRGSHLAKGPGTGCHR